MADLIAYIACELIWGFVLAHLGISIALFLLVMGIVITAAALA